MSNQTTRKGPKRPAGYWEAQNANAVAGLVDMYGDFGQSKKSTTKKEPPKKKK